MNNWIRIAGTFALSTFAIFGTIACGGGGGGGGQSSTLVAPSDPDLGLQARAVSTTRILLTWEAPQNEPDAFVIQRSEDGVQYVTVGSVDGNRHFYSDFTLERGVTRFYRIRTQTGTLVSNPSEVALATTQDCEVASGPQSDHNLALKADGTVWAWGKNDRGQLGFGPYASSSFYPLPSQVKYPSGDPLEEIISIAPGASHSLALRSDGTVWAWGNNDHGQLGRGTAGGSSPDPIQVMKTESIALENIVAIAAGEKYSLALSADSSVWAWGRNYEGQLGLGNYYMPPVTYAVHVLQDDSLPLGAIVAIAAGKDHNLALTFDGRVLAWGEGTSGKLGYDLGYQQKSHTPAPVMETPENPLKNIVSIAAGTHHSLALSVTGSVLAWGLDNQGQLGDGIEIATGHTPVAVVTEDGTPLQDIVSISSGDRHNLAGKSDGTLLGWGVNEQGQLGIGTTPAASPHAQPVMLDENDPLEMTRSIGTGRAHSLAVLPDGTILSWGENHYGSLGNGMYGFFNEEPYPVEVLLEESIPFNLYE